MIHNNKETGEIEKMVSDMDQNNFSKNEVNVLIQLTSITTKLDNINHSITNHNDKIDGYKNETDKLIMGLRNDMKERDKEYKKEIERLKARMDKNDKFAYKVTGGLIIISLVWAFLSKFLVSFFMNGGS